MATLSRGVERANNFQESNRGSNQGQSSRRDDDDRSQRTQGRGDREQKETVAKALDALVPAGWWSFEG